MAHGAWWFGRRWRCSGCAGGGSGTRKTTWQRRVEDVVGWLRTLHEARMTRSDRPIE
ncbi:hypothetical protein JB92DRAFT_2971879 [Gautieria morchelliformis]|nr:hypothetical protein JB92DRAFT_2971879 [Gautieria morchelliformis]